MIGRRSAVNDYCSSQAQSGEYDDCSLLCCVNHILSLTTRKVISPLQERINSVSVVFLVG